MLLPRFAVQLVRVVSLLIGVLVASVMVALGDRGKANRLDVDSLQITEM